MQELPPGDSRIPLNKSGKAVGNASGLYFKAQMAVRTSAGHDLFELMRGGFIKDISVQFANRKEDEEITRDGVRNVKMVHTLFEMSAVPKGASIGSQVLATKGAFPAWMLSLIEKTAEDAEDRMYLALEEAESRAWYESQEQAAVNAAAERLVDIVRGQLDRELQVAEIEKRVGISGNVFKVAPRLTPRPLTEREKFEQDIARRAGVLVG
jgi:hypothetical protein